MKIKIVLDIKLIGETDVLDENIKNTVIEGIDNVLLRKFSEFIKECNISATLEEEK